MQEKHTFRFLEEWSGGVKTDVHQPLQTVRRGKTLVAETVGLHECLKCVRIFV